MAKVALRNDLAPDDLAMRFGRRWGSTMYIGLISSVGRTEVTALGDEVDECARIEDCATGGRTLASKLLIERLTPVAAADLGVDTNRIDYVQLGDLSTATDKARRDAPSIAVYERCAGCNSGTFRSVNHAARQAVVKPQQLPGAVGRSVVDASIHVAALRTTISILPSSSAPSAFSSAKPTCRGR